MKPVVALPSATSPVLFNSCSPANAACISDPLSFGQCQEFGKCIATRGSWKRVGNGGLGALGSNIQLWKLESEIVRETWSFVGLKSKRNPLAACTRIAEAGNSCRKDETTLSDLSAARAGIVTGSFDNDYSLGAKANLTGNLLGLDVVGRERRTKPAKCRQKQTAFCLLRNCGQCRFWVPQLNSLQAKMCWKKTMCKGAARLAVEAQGGEETVSESSSSLLMGSATTERRERLLINLDLDLYRAKCLRKKGANEEADAILKQCIKDWPCDGRAYVALGNSLSKQGKYKVARAVYEDGCQAAQGENAYIWQAWAILEEKCGNIAKARKLFDASTVADLKHSAAWHGWAMLELRQCNSKKARELLSKGMKYCAANEYLLQTLALIESKAGCFDEARALFNHATDCNPKSCASWLAWAQLESEQGNSTMARYLFQRGIQASPRNRYVWQAWALFEAKGGNKGQARNLFQRGCELNPKDAVLHQAFALFEYQCSHSDTAREIFKKAAALDPNHQPIWIGWGWMEWKEGNLEEARAFYKRSLAVNSQNMDAARTFQAWGILEQRDGNHGMARELFKRALKVDSQNVAAWMSWVNLEEEIGNTIRAEEIRNIYLQQRTVIVDELPLEMKLSSIFAPAMDHIMSLLNMEMQPNNQTTTNFSQLRSMAGYKDMDDANGTSSGEEFDIDSFLKEKFPWKYCTDYNKFRTNTRYQSPTS
eukprot:c26983_g1_i2 orf=157-2283(+)